MKLIYKFDLWFSINLILYYILFLCFIFKVKKIIKINIKLYVIKITLKKKKNYLLFSKYENKLYKNCFLLICFIY